MMVPANRPRMTEADILARVRPMGILDSDKIFVAGVRGYYRDTMGKAGVNDRGIYDDALFIVAPGLHFGAYNGNTDPSSHRKGKGKGAGKGMASLKAGLYRAHQFGAHRGKYRALIQTGGPVTVIRDGAPPYEDTGYFGINIHKGGFNTTSSEGCQTIHPDQWLAFMASVTDLAKRCAPSGGVIPYVLFDA